VLDEQRATFDAGGDENVPLKLVAIKLLIGARGDKKLGPRNK
jgi:hypothetical protein